MPVFYECLVICGRADKGAYVVHEGDVGEGVYFIWEGEVNLFAPLVSVL